MPLSAPEELAARSRAFEGARPQEILEWTLAEYAPRVAISTAFGVEGCALIDMAWRIDPAVRVFTVDTDFLFPETRGLIDARMLGRLRRGAQVINIARGEIMDEAALTQGLTAGRIAGAYLDVFQKEPLPPDSPLWDMPNVIVTPHNSPAASGQEQRVYELFVENLARWHARDPLINEVRRET